MVSKFITSESVTEGHPDKLCDQISDAILDEYLYQDSNSHVAVETAASGGTIMVFGEVKSNAVVDIQKVVRDVVRRVGYVGGASGLDYRTVGILNMIIPQSQEIDDGVEGNSASKTGEDLYESQGAGDQGVMFGYASNEMKELMPLPILLASRIAKQLSNVRKNEGICWKGQNALLPDGKVQVTIEYRDDKPFAVSAVLVSTQHINGVDLVWLRGEVQSKVILPVLQEVLEGMGIRRDFKFLFNPAGTFTLGGPLADAGLTGRKIIVDTYGGAAKHGGGCFSGKDPSKVDRSAAYAARWVAKNIVAAGLADKVELQISYAIGRAEPVSYYVDTFNTAKEDVTDDMLAKAIQRVFDLRPAAIIDELNLKTPFYKDTAAYGHFGWEGTARNNYSYTWEVTNRVDDLLHAVKELQ